MAQQYIFGTYVRNAMNVQPSLCGDSEFKTELQKAKLVADKQQRSWIDAIFDDFSRCVNAAENYPPAVDMCRSERYMTLQMLLDRSNL